MSEGCLMRVSILSIILFNFSFISGLDAEARSGKVDWDCNWRPIFKIVCKPVTASEPGAPFIKPLEFSSCEEALASSQLTPDAKIKIRNIYQCNTKVNKPAVPTNSVKAGKSI